MLKYCYLKTIFILISIQLITFCSHKKVIAQTLTDTAISKQITLAPLVITAERTPVMFEQLKRSIQVITKKEIEQMPVRNVAELLGYALNTDIRSRGSFGMQADISIRGGSFDQTLVLLNGMNISDPQTGHHNMDIPIDLASINRIEILKGPGARVFGPNAFNGVINIITNEKTADQLSLSALGGQFGLFSLSASAGLNFGKSTHKFQISKSGSDGFMKNTDFSALNLFYGGTAGKLQQLDYQAAFIKKAFGANSFYTPKYPDQFEITTTSFVSFRFKTYYKGFSPAVYFRRHYDEFRLFRDDTPAWYKTHNYHFTDVIGSNANIWTSTGVLGKLSVGYDFRHEMIRSNKLGDSLQNFIPIAGKEGQFYTLGKSRSSAGFFIEQSLNLKRASFSAGILASYLSALPGRMTVYPGIDVAYKLWKNFRVFANANRTLRLPTFTDLYYNDNTSKGDPGLKPEEAITIEGGIKFNKPGVVIHAAVFKRYGHNMIDWVKMQNQDPWQVKNITNINVSGFETSFSLKMGELAGSNKILTGVTFGYSFLIADKSSKDFMSRYALDLLRHKAELLVNHRIWNNVSASWSISYQDREGGFIQYTNQVPETTETPYKPFVLLDFQLNYKRKNWLLFVEGTNLTGNTYVDYGNVPQPGRWFRVGVTYATPLKISEKSGS